MAVDLNLSNRLFEKTKILLEKEGPSSAEIDYLTILFVCSTLLINKALAQEFVDETWEGKE